MLVRVEPNCACSLISFPQHQSSVAREVTLNGPFGFQSDFGCENMFQYNGQNHVCKERGSQVTSNHMCERMCVTMHGGVPGAKVLGMCLANSFRAWQGTTISDSD